MEITEGVRFYLRHLSNALMLGSTQMYGHAYAYCDVINICMKKMGLGLVM